MCIHLLCKYLSKMLQQNIPVLGAGDGKVLITIQPPPVASGFLSFGAFRELGGLCQTENRG